MYNISIFEIDVIIIGFSLSAHNSKTNFINSGRQRENRVMHGSSLAAIWFGLRSWGKQRVRAYFSRRQIVCTMIFILCAIIMLQAGILYRLRRNDGKQTLGTKQLRYIEEWLDLLYLYNNDPVSFHTRCKELASVKRLSNYHIVNDSLRLSDCRRHRRSNLTPAEKEFLCLMEAGFSNRALCVIFRVGKVGSIYVKHHRIKQRS